MRKQLPEQIVEGSKAIELPVLAYYGTNRAYLQTPARRTYSRSFIADGTATIHPSTHLQSSDVSSHGLTIKKMRSVERRKNEKISIIEILYWNL